MKLNEAVEYINSLKDYEGYVQFSDKKLEIFNKTKNINLVLNNNFIYEAHFYNEHKKTSISIHQINDEFLLSQTQIPDKLDKNDEETFYYHKNKKFRMIQIWEKQKDENCDNLDVLKLTKVVFGGFIEDKKEIK